MPSDPWLPKGFPLPGGSSTESLRFAGDCWQIWSAADGIFSLLAHPEIAEKWCQASLIDKDVLKTVSFGSKRLGCIVSHGKFVLEPITTWRGASDKESGLSFCRALSRSRYCVPDVSFCDAIFCEQYSCLLPTWTNSDYVPDDELLGKWLSRGVGVSASSKRRLVSLVSWLQNDDFPELIETAGIVINHNVSSDEKNTGYPLENKTKNIKKGFCLPGRPYLERFFNEHIVDIIDNSEKYQKMGIGFPAAVILHGPPGCGKTFAVEQLAKFLDWPVFSIDSGAIGSPHIHQTSKKIAEVFERAIQEAPSMVIIDEMEAFLTTRSYGNSSGLHHIEEVAEFLRRIPEATQNRVLIVGMTNMIKMIDPAILRRGRFDHIIEVGMPSATEVASLIRALIKDIPQETNIDIESVSKALTGKPLSDVAYAIREACRLSVRLGKSKVDDACLRTAIDSFTSR